MAQMISKSSKSILSMKEYKALLLEAASASKTFLETAHLHSGNQFLLRNRWPKDRRDIASKSANAA